MHALKRTVAPTELPVTLDEAKAHLRETASALDPDIASYIRAVVDWLDGPEGILARALVTQTLQLSLDDFPRSCADGIVLPLPPLQSVGSIAYLDADGNSQTLSSAVYRVLDAGVPTRRGRVVLDYNQSWPATRGVEDAVTVTYVAGYGARNAVPESTRMLILALVKELYDHREPWTDAGTVRSPALAGLIARARFPAVV